MTHEKKAHYENLIDLLVNIWILNLHQMQKAKSKHL